MNALVKRGDPGEKLRMAAPQEHSAAAPEENGEPMPRRHCRTPLALVIMSLIALGTTACGGSGSSTKTQPPAIIVNLTPGTAQTMDVGQTLAITANVANDTSNKGVTWVVSGGGTLSSQTATSTAYNAPASVTAAITATVTATSVASGSATASLGITVNPPPAIATTSLPAGTVGTAYSATLQSAGGTAPITWSISAGTLPAWASFNTVSGALTGTPTAAGSTNISVIATDKAGVKTAATALSLAIAPAPLAFTTTTLPAATKGAAYSATLQASGGTGPYAFSLASGSLPTWANLTAGVISGTPNATGSTSFTVQVTDSAATPAKATQALTLTVNPPAALAISTTTLPAATVGVAYSTSVQATGGIAPYTWGVSSGTLPAWASLATSTGVISGTPSGTGSASFTLQVKDSQGTPATASQALTLTTNPSGAHDSLLKGQYAFVAADSANVAVLAGSITADGSGHISAGEFDFQGASTVPTATATAIASGSYAVGSDNRGVVSFSDGAGHTFGFSVALGSVSNSVATFGGITENDASSATLLTGKLELQSSGAFSLGSLTGGYAFELAGNLGAGSGNFAEVGSLSLASGAISNGLLDSNQAGAITASAAFSGSVAAVDAHGRALVTITSSGSTSTLAAYVVSATRIDLVQVNSGSGPAIYGEALQQSGAPFSAGSLNGNTILLTQSQTGVPSAHVNLGLITFDGVSALNGFIDTNDGGTITSNAAISGASYALASASNGRFTVSGTGKPVVGYLVGPNSAFMTEVGTGSSPTMNRLLPQATGPFTAASLQGAFAISTIPMLAAPVNAPTGIPPATFETGAANFDGLSAVSTTIDTARPGGADSPGLTASDGYSVANNGRITITTSPFVGYIVSPTRILLVQVQPNNPNPTILDLRQ